MAYHRRKKRKMSVQIIPMIDILTILLIFFVLTTTWREEQGLLKINIPNAEKLSSAASKEIMRKLLIDAEGKIALDDEIIVKEDLPALLQKIKNENPKSKIALKADGEVDLQELVYIWDSMKKAGFPISQAPMSIKIKKNND